MKITEIEIGDLKPYGLNAKKHPQSQIEGIAESIRRFGFTQPIVVDRENTIICGHGRVEGAKLAGISQVPCLRLEELTDQEVKALRLIDNRIQETGWDPGLLKLDLEGLEINLGDFNVSFDDLDFEVETLPGLTDPDSIPGLPEKPESNPGDLYLLGQHRLLCGDSTVQTDLDRLMDGQQADLVFTDPPYNVDYKGGTSKKLKILNDSMEDGKFFQFLLDAFTAAWSATKEGGAFYICHADSEGLNFRRAMTEAGWLTKQCLIWVKNCHVLGRQDYQWRHEPILYGWKPGKAHYWNGGRCQNTVIEPSRSIAIQDFGDHQVLSFTEDGKTVSFKANGIEPMTGDPEAETIWRVDKPKRNSEHPTAKPVELSMRAIRNSSRPDAVVLDPFLGSGATLISCEQTGRRCFGMELDPRYVDVIVKRWESFTGKKVVLENGSVRKRNNKVLQGS